MNEQIPVNTATISVNKEVANEMLHQTANFKSSLVCIKAGVELKSHTSPTDAFILLLEGKGVFTIEGKSFELHQNDYFSFKANETHSLKAIKDLRMLLVR